MSAWMAIARREWRGQFVSPLAWAVLATMVALAAWMLLSGIDTYTQLAPRYFDRPGSPGVTDLLVAPFFASLAGVLLFVVPLLTMRAIVGERRDGTLALLYAAGASDSAIALGKFAGALAVPMILLLILIAMPLSLSVGTDLDLGKVFAAALGLVLLVSALTAVGVLCSALAHHPASAALGAMAVGVFGWIADTAARERGVTDGVLNWIAVPTHLTAFMRGIVASVDVAYFILVIVLCLGLATQRIAGLREHGG